MRNIDRVRWIFTYSLGFYLINVLMISLTLNTLKNICKRKKNDVWNLKNNILTKDTNKRILRNATLPHGYINILEFFILRTQWTMKEGKPIRRNLQTIKMKPEQRTVFKTDALIHCKTQWHCSQDTVLSIKGGMQILRLNSICSLLSKFDTTMKWRIAK